MIQFIGEVVFDKGKSVKINREIAHNSDLPYIILEETIKALMEGGATRRNAIFEAGSCSTMTRAPSAERL